MRASISTDHCDDTGVIDRALARNTQYSASNALPPASPPYAEFRLKPPIIAAPLLSGGEIGFLEFLAEPAFAAYCVLLLGCEATSAATMLREFRQATEFHYFGFQRIKHGHKKSPTFGMLTAPNAKTKVLIKKYARRAYRGDPERRGVTYWERVAWLVWNCYATLMALRCRAKTIRQQELKRMASLPEKRAGRAAYMRKYRTKRRAKGAGHTKPEAKEAWRQRRSQTEKEKPNEH